MKPIIETARTRLTFLTEGDFDDMLDMLEDPETTQYIRHLHCRGTVEYQAVLQNRLEQIMAGTGFHWVGRLKSSHELVGAVNLSLIPGTVKMQLGFQLRQEFWGKGFATELASGVLELAAEDKGLSEIYGVFDKANLASKRVLEKLGFERYMEDRAKEENVVTYQFVVPKSVASA